MEIYLPIAEMSVHWVYVVALGLSVGFLSGLFGVGGGFLLTPLLVFYGIPSTVAVGTTLSHITASSVSGAMEKARHRLPHGRGDAGRRPRRHRVRRLAVHADAPPGPDGPDRRAFLC